MMMIKKRGFTLLELLVCITILGMIASVIATPIKSAIGVNRHKNQLYALLGKMQMASSLSLSYGVPMNIALHSVGDTLYFQFITDEPLKGVDRSEKKIQGITKFLCDGKEVKKVLLTATPSGFWSPCDSIAIQTTSIERIELKNQSVVSLSHDEKTKRHQFLSRKEIL